MGQLLTTICTCMISRCKCVSSPFDTPPIKKITLKSKTDYHCKHTFLPSQITKARLSGLLVEEQMTTQRMLHENCTVPCFDNQANIYNNYWIFASFYIVTDIEGFLEQNFDSDKDKQ